MSDSEPENYNVVQVSSSDNELTSDSEDEILPVKKKHTWKFNSTFKTKEEADNWITEEDMFSPANSYETNKGRRVIFRCNMVPARGVQCDCALYLLYHSESQQVSSYISHEPHNHEEILAVKPKTGFNEATKSNYLVFFT